MDRLNDAAHALKHTHTNASCLSIQYTAMPPLLTVSSPLMHFLVSQEWEILSVKVKQPLIICMLENINLSLHLHLHYVITAELLPRGMCAVKKNVCHARPPKQNCGLFQNVIFFF